MLQSQEGLRLLTRELEYGQYPVFHIRLVVGFRLPWYG